MSKSRLDEIRRYCDTYSGSSDVEKIEYVLAELDRLTKDRDEARAQQAHTASCNIELMRKFDARDADVIQIDAALQDAYGAIEKLQVMVMKQDEALRFYAEPYTWSRVHADVLSGHVPSKGIENMYSDKARKALGDKE